MTVKTAKVAVACPFDKVFDYLVPENLDLSIGNIVQVPFGRRMVTGVVWKFGEKNPKLKTSQLKRIGKKISKTPLKRELLSFIKWVSDYNLIPLGSVVKMVISPLKSFSNPKKRVLFGLGSGSTENIRYTERQKKLFDFLKNNSSEYFSAAEIKEEVDVGLSTIRSLVKKSLVNEKIDVVDEVKQETDREFDLFALSKVQENAFDYAAKKIDEKNHSVTVLEGTTGSGKTEVYFHGIAKILKESRAGQILILLPEIALTVQLIDRFEKQFGFKPAVWHSQIGSAEKRNIWNGLISGNVRAVFGARSALFLPFKKLSLIVVDEEHDASFKQEENGNYNGRDMAVVRAKINKISIILSSATPSLETLFNVEKGKYQKICLPNRFGNAVLPEIEIVDLKKDKVEKNKYISKVLISKIRENLVNKKQTLLFLNRRGFAPVILCKECGHKVGCPDCSCTLTKHKFYEKLLCHCCGYSINLLQSCPECQKEDCLIDFGPGVEKIEQEVSQCFPNAKTLILTSDTLKTPKHSEQFIGEILNKNVDIIIGTQLVAKGHHFPDLTLVGILDADAGLFGGDMRASERTYQLLTQVSGRAGRGQEKGLVIIQTHSPDNLVLKAIKTGGKGAIVDFDLNARKLLNFPPFGRIALILFSGRDKNKVLKTAKEIVKNFPKVKGAEILGPSPALIFKRQKDYRYKVVIKTSKNVNIQKLIKNLVSLVKIPGCVRIRIDIDPVGLV